jgi:hypothetical protein
LAVDIDPRNGGEDAWSALSINQVVPNTAEQSTGGGGRHLMFSDPGGRVAKSLAPGIDLKGEGGYVVVAPSRHVSGQRYQWRGNWQESLLKPTEMPAWMLRKTRAINDGANVERAKTAADGIKWTRGERNTRLTSLAGTMQQRGMTRDAIEAALLAENSKRCDPPLGHSEVEGIASGIGRYKPADEKNQGNSPARQRRSQATRLVDLASAAELFHTSGNEGYAAIQVDGHREIWRLRDREFRRWLARGFHERHRNVPSSNALSDALGVLEGRALFDAPQHAVFTRIARLEDSLYLDLGNAKWEAVKITSAGWKVVRDPIALFRRPRGLKALPRPKRNGSISELWDFVNVRKADRVIVAAWLVGAYQVGAPFPILVLQGEQGTAKSTTARLLRQLVDPNESALRSQPREVRDLMIAAKNGWLVAFDNISWLPVWMSDALCRLATGGGFATRELYSDDQEIIFDATRPILLNGIDGVVVRGDLLDRSLVLELPVISPDRRRPENELRAGFHAAQPRILGALLSAISSALRHEGTMTFANLPRMADFAAWAAGAESVLGFPAGRIIDAVARNQTDLNTLPLDASPIVPPLRRLLQRHGAFKGTATDLLHKLEWSLQGERDKRPYGWPRTPHALSCSIHRLAPNLRAAGVSVTFGKTAGAGSRRLVQIEDQGGIFSGARDASDADESER